MCRGWRKGSTGRYFSPVPKGQVQTVFFRQATPPSQWASSPLPKDASNPWTLFFQSRIRKSSGCDGASRRGVYPDNRRNHRMNLTAFDELLEAGNDEGHFTPGLLH